MDFAICSKQSHATGFASLADKSQLDFCAPGVFTSTGSSRVSTGRGSPASSVASSATSSTIHPSYSTEVLQPMPSLPPSLSQGEHGQPSMAAAVSSQSLVPPRSQAVDDDDWSEILNNVSSPRGSVRSCRSTRSSTSFTARTCSRSPCHTQRERCRTSSGILSVESLTLLKSADDDVDNCRPPVGVVNSVYSQNPPSDRAPKASVKNCTQSGEREISLKPVQVLEKPTIIESTSENKSSKLAEDEEREQLSIESGNDPEADFSEAAEDVVPAQGDKHDAEERESGRPVLSDSIDGSLLETRKPECSDSIYNISESKRYRISPVPDLKEASNVNDVDDRQQQPALHTPSDLPHEDSVAPDAISTQDDGESQPAPLSGETNNAAFYQKPVESLNWDSDILQEESWDKIVDTVASTSETKNVSTSVGEREGVITDSLNKCELRELDAEQVMCDDQDGSKDTNYPNMRSLSFPVDSANDAEGGDAISNVDESFASPADVDIEGDRADGSIMTISAQVDSTGETQGAADEDAREVEGNCDIFSSVLRSDRDWTSVDDSSVREGRELISPNARSLNDETNDHAVVDNHDDDTTHMCSDTKPSDRDHTGASDFGERKLWTEWGNQADNHASAESSNLPTDDFPVEPQCKDDAVGNVSSANSSENTMPVESITDGGSAGFEGSLQESGDAPTELILQCVQPRSPSATNLEQRSLGGESTGPTEKPEESIVHDEQNNIVSDAPETGIYDADDMSGTHNHGSKVEETIEMNFEEADFTNTQNQDICNSTLDVGRRNENNCINADANPGENKSWNVAEVNSEDTVASDTPEISAPSAASCSNQEVNGADNLNSVHGGRSEPGVESVVSFIRSEMNIVQDYSTLDDALPCGEHRDVRDISSGSHSIEYDECEEAAVSNKSTDDSFAARDRDSDRLCGINQITLANSLNPSDSCCVEECVASASHEDIKTGAEDGGENVPSFLTGWEGFYGWNDDNGEDDDVQHLSPSVVNRHAADESEGPSTALKSRTRTPSAEHLVESAEESEALKDLSSEDPIVENVKSAVDSVDCGEVRSPVPITFVDNEVPTASITSAKAFDDIEPTSSRAEPSHSVLPADEESSFEELKVVEQLAEPILGESSELRSPLQSLPSTAAASTVDQQSFSSPRTGNVQSSAVNTLSVHSSTHEQVAAVSPRDVSAAEDDASSSSAARKRTVEGDHAGVFNDKDALCSFDDWTWTEKGKNSANDSGAYYSLSQTEESAGFDLSKAERPIVSTSEACGQTIADNDSASLRMLDTSSTIVSSPTLKHSSMQLPDPVDSADVALTTKPLFDLSSFSELHSGQAENEEVMLPHNASENISSNGESGKVSASLVSHRDLVSSERHVSQDEASRLPFAENQCRETDPFVEASRDFMEVRLSSERAGNDMLSFAQFEDHDVSEGCPQDLLTVSDHAAQRLPARDVSELHEQSVTNNTNEIVRIEDTVSVNDPVTSQLDQPPITDIGPPTDTYSTNAMHPAPVSKDREIPAFPAREKAYNSSPEVAQGDILEESNRRSKEQVSDGIEGFSADETSNMFLSGSSGRDSLPKPPPSNPEETVTEEVSTSGIADESSHREMTLAWEADTNDTSSALRTPSPSEVASVSEQIYAADEGRQDIYGENQARDNDFSAWMGRDVEDYVELTDKRDQETLPQRTALAEDHGGSVIEQRGSLSEEQNPQALQSSWDTEWFFKDDTFAAVPADSFDATNHACPVNADSVSPANRGDSATNETFGERTSDSQDERAASSTLDNSYSVVTATELSGQQDLRNTLDWSLRQHREDRSHHGRSASEGLVADSAREFSHQDHSNKLALKEVEPPQVLEINGGSFDSKEVGNVALGEHASFFGESDKPSEDSAVKHESARNDEGGLWSTSFTASVFVDENKGTCDDPGTWESQEYASTALNGAKSALSLHSADALGTVDQSRSTTARGCGDEPSAHASRTATAPEASHSSTVSIGDTHNSFDGFHLFASGPSAPPGDFLEDSGTHSASQQHADASREQSSEICRGIQRVDVAGESPQPELDNEARGMFEGHPLEVPREDAGHLTSCELTADFAKKEEHFDEYREHLSSFEASAISANQCVDKSASVAPVDSAEERENVSRRKISHGEYSSDSVAAFRKEPMSSFQLPRNDNTEIKQEHMLHIAPDQSLTVDIQDDFAPSKHPSPESEAVSVENIPRRDSRRDAEPSVSEQSMVSSGDAQWFTTHQAGGGLFSTEISPPDADLWRESGNGACEKEFGTLTTTSACQSIHVADSSAKSAPPSQSYMYPGEMRDSAESAYTDEAASDLFRPRLSSPSGEPALPVFKEKEDRTSETYGSFSHQSIQFSMATESDVDSFRDPGHVADEPLKIISATPAVLRSSERSEVASGRLMESSVTVENGEYIISQQERERDAQRNQLDSERDERNDFHQGSSSQAMRDTTYLPDAQSDADYQLIRPSCATDGDVVHAAIDIAGSGEQDIRQFAHDQTLTSSGIPVESCRVSGEIRHGASGVEVVQGDTRGRYSASPTLEPDFAHKSSVVEEWPYRVPSGGSFPLTGGVLLHVDSAGSNFADQSANQVQDRQLNILRNDEQLNRNSFGQEVSLGMLGSVEEASTRSCFNVDSDSWTAPDMTTSATVATDAVEGAHDVQACMSSTEVDESMPALANNIFTIMNDGVPPSVSDDPPRSAISWGFGGSLVMVKSQSARSSRNKNDIDDQGVNGDVTGFSRTDSVVQLFDVGQVVSNSGDEDWMAVKDDFVHDLFSQNQGSMQNPTAEMSDFCDKMSSVSTSSQGSLCKSSSAMWRVLASLCREPEHDTATVLASMLKSKSGLMPLNAEQSSSASHVVDHSHLYDLTRLITRDREAELVADCHKAEELFLAGKGFEAVAFAQQVDLWPLALIFAAASGSNSFMSTLSSFARTAFGDGTPLQLICLMLSKDFEKLAQVCTGDAALKSWDTTLAVLSVCKSYGNIDGEICSSVMASVGRALLRNGNDVAAYHICHLASGQLSELTMFESADRDFVLLGAAKSCPCRRPFSFGSCAAILKSIIFEKVCQAQGKPSFDHLLPFKFVLAREMTVLGRSEAAFFLCQSMASSARRILNERNKDALSIVTPAFVAGLRELSRQLLHCMGRQNSFDVEEFDLTEMLRAHNLERKHAEEFSGFGIETASNTVLESTGTRPTAMTNNVSTEYEQSSFDGTSAIDSERINTLSPEFEFTGVANLRSHDGSPLDVSGSVSSPLAYGAIHSQNFATTANQDQVGFLAVDNNYSQLSMSLDSAFQSQPPLSSAHDLVSADLSDSRREDQAVGVGISTEGTRNRHQQGRPPLPPSSRTDRDESTAERKPRESAKPSASSWGLRSMLQRRFAGKLPSLLGGRKQAHLGDKNAFVYSKELGRWVEEGQDITADAMAPPPPPDDADLDGADSTASGSASVLSTKHSASVYSEGLHQMSPAPEMMTSAVSNSEDFMAGDISLSPGAIPFLPSQNFGSKTAGEEASPSSDMRAGGDLTQHKRPSSFAEFDAPAHNLDAGVRPNRYRAGRRGRSAYVDTFNRTTASNASVVPGRVLPPNAFQAAAVRPSIFTPSESLDQNGKD